MSETIHASPLRQCVVGLVLRGEATVLAVGPLDGGPAQLVARDRADVARLVRVLQTLGEELPEVAT